jgi:MarR family transcriptional regulator, 2-MHQ and catechol-resistance regulon repressor
MGIETDIKQVSKFRNEKHKAGVNLLFTGNWLLERQRFFFERGGLTAQQYNILRILRGSGQPLSTLQIRERMLDRMSDTSRIVDRLLLKNLVEKKISEKDKRLVDVLISQKGLELLAKLDTQNDELDAVLMGISDEEAAEINRLLDKIRACVSPE